MSSAQVSQLFRAAAFDPEGIEKLCAAYDLATSQLHDRDRHSAAVNEIIAQRIIGFAEQGDPEHSRSKGLIFDLIRGGPCSFSACNLREQFDAVARGCEAW